MDDACLRKGGFPCGHHGGGEAEHRNQTEPPLSTESAMLRILDRSGNCTDPGLLLQTELLHIESILIVRVIGDTVVVHLRCHGGGLLFPAAEPNAGTLAARILIFAECRETSYR